MHLRSEPDLSTLLGGDVCFFFIVILLYSLVIKSVAVYVKF